MGQSKTFTRSIIEYFVSYKSIKVYLIIRVKEGVIIPRDKLYGKVSKGKPYYQKPSRRTQNYFTLES